jgi:hypothetical protein
LYPFPLPLAKIEQAIEIFVILKLVMKTSLIYAALILAFISSVTAQNNWDAYQPRTLKEITTTIAEKSLKDPDVVYRGPKNEAIMMLSYNSYQSKVNVIYSGESRKVSDERKEVIKFWIRTLGKPKEIIDLFENEYRFTENKVEYWLPVQKPVASYFPKELKKGDTVTLLVAWLGGRYQTEGFDNVFLVNEFEKED